MPAKRWLLLLAFAVVAPPLSAQEQKNADADEPWHLTSNGQDVCAVTSFLAAIPAAGQGELWGVVGNRLLAGERDKGLPHWKFAFEKALPLPRAYLEATSDNRPLPTIRYKELKELGRDLGFYMLLNEAIDRVYWSDEEQFVNSAEETKDVVYPHLAATPERYRGKVVTVKGKLEVIRKVDTPRRAAQWYGAELPQIYTGYVTNPNKGIPPYTIVFTDLPAGVEPSEDAKLQVTFHGYFLALVKFPIKQPSGRVKELVMPYMVGKTFTIDRGMDKKGDVAAPEEEPRGFLSAPFIATAVGAFALIGVLMAFLNFWLRRGDKKVEDRLAEVMHRQRPFSMEHVDEPPPLPADGAHSEPPPN
jgi:hypothetical protein